ncbi:hypothetical protein CCMSSC00406_0005290 [Pleurotus cornucopiae]|uniref:Uncharacterized protein n=1 Tax=Pleurotus cornucopiae TaxID=5321 RepID=A0ACB7IQQ9_PLECO|nr:hypothetical protein CCMSSC00406_0005290 [Pleurotus cornucopiae]
MDYMNLNTTRKLLGVETPGEFSSCSSAVSAGFAAHMDKWRSPTQVYVAQLLERGIRVLIYAGTYDWQCNWVANKLWLEKLEWSGKHDYNLAQFSDWTVDGNKAGEVKHAGLLSFATIRGAGHMMSLRDFDGIEQEADGIRSFVFRSLMISRKRHSLCWRGGWPISYCDLMEDVLDQISRQDNMERRHHDRSQFTTVAEFISYPSVGVLGYRTSMKVDHGVRKVKVESFRNRANPSNGTDMCGPSIQKLASQHLFVSNTSDGGGKRNPSS